MDQPICRAPQALSPHLGTSGIRLLDEWSESFVVSQVRRLKHGAAMRWRSKLRLKAWYNK